MASWSDIGEGLDGFYDPNDPNDIPLLRFDVYELIDGEWEYIQDTSYCTMMRVGSPDWVLSQALNLILDRVEASASSGGSIKKACESLSWMSDSWFSLNDKTSPST